jgi:hypothetical protein
MSFTPDVIPRDWVGEVAYVVGGGTSVQLADVQSLQERGKNVIAVNSSYRIALFADILYFADERWWTREITLEDHKLREFLGQVWTVSRISKDIQDVKLKRLRRVKPEVQGLALSPDTVTMEWTSVQSAINIAMHKGADRVVVLGLDNQPSPSDPQRFHHHAEYPWPHRLSTWQYKYDNLAHAVPVLEQQGVKVFNASPISTIDFWPVVTVAETLDWE